MTRTWTETILREHRAPGVADKGRYIPVQPDLYLLPEYAVALIDEKLAKLGGSRVDPDRLLVVADHFAPPSSIERAEIVRHVERIVEREGWSAHFHRFAGICHQIMLEDARLQPGSLVVGADSHTVTGGAVGAYAAGFGSHDLLYALRTAAIWLRPGPALAVRFVGGALPRFVHGKDLILELFRRLGPEGFHRRSLEFYDETDAGLGFDDRAAICNMVVDGGATNGLFAPADARAADGAYEAVIEIDVDRVRPLVAHPGSPFRVTPVDELPRTPITQAYLGSCNAGRRADFTAAAELVRGRPIDPAVRAIAIPSSQQVYLELLHSGELAPLVEAGVVIGNPSCGPCGGIDKGILGAGDVCIATMNRNFRGRMGSPESDIWLANAAVVAASAVAGRIAHPAEVAA